MYFACMAECTIQLIYNEGSIAINMSSIDKNRIFMIFWIVGVFITCISVQIFVHYPTIIRYTCISRITNVKLSNSWQICNVVWSIFIFGENKVVFQIGGNNLCISLPQIVVDNVESCGRFSQTWVEESRHLPTVSSWAKGRVIHVSLPIACLFISSHVRYIYDYKYMMVIN